MKLRLPRKGAHQQIAIALTFIFFIAIFQLGAPHLSLSQTEKTKKTAVKIPQPRYVRGELIVSYRYKKTAKSTNYEGAGISARQREAAAAIMAGAGYKGRVKSEPLYPELVAAMERKNESEAAVIAGFATGLSPAKSEMLRQALTAGEDAGFSRKIVIKTGKKTDIQKLAGSIMKNRNLGPAGIFVENASPNYIYSAAGVPDDTMFPQQHSLSALSLSDSWPPPQDARGAVIAVIDDGVRFMHPELSGQMWVNDDPPGDADADGSADDDFNGFADDVFGFDFVRRPADKCRDSDCSEADNDPQSTGNHGTAAAGIISAKTNNASGIASICPNCRIMALRAGHAGKDETVLTSRAIAEAISYASLNGADIVNLGLVNPALDRSIEQELNFAKESGVIIVAAAGNYSSSRKFYPAAFKDVISVAASAADDTLLENSNYGNWITIAAPGSGIVSLAGDSDYAAYSGTSMAAAHVSGLIGMFLSAKPDATLAQVRERLNSSLRPLKKGKVKAPSKLKIIDAPSFVEGLEIKTDLTPTPIVTPSVATPTPTVTPTVTPDLETLDFCQKDPQKTAPGICGCGTPDVDSDGNGTFDCNEMGRSDSGNISPFEADRVQLESAAAPAPAAVNSQTFGSISAEAEALDSNPTIGPSDWVTLVADENCISQGRVTPFFRGLLVLSPDFNSANLFNDSARRVQLGQAISRQDLEARIELDPCVIGVTDVETLGEARLEAVSFNDPESNNQSYLNDIKFGDGFETLRTLSNNWNKKVTVGTVDTGFDIGNLDFNGLLSPNLEGSNLSELIFRRGLESPDVPQDTIGHGTGVASIISANFNNSRGIVGMASRTAILYPIKIARTMADLDELHGSTALFESIRRSVNAGAEVINISVNTLSKPDGLCDPVIGHAIYRAIERKVFVVIAAGAGKYKDDNGVLIPGDLPSPSDDGPQVFGPTSSPACWGRYFKGAITVAGLKTGTKGLDVFSNYGEAIEIAAPSTGIRTYGLDDQLMTVSGTSYAAPQVSAAVSLAISIFKERNWRYSPWLIEDVILNGSPRETDLSSYINGGRVLNIKDLSDYISSLSQLTEDQRQRIPSDNNRSGKGWKPDEGVNNIERVVIAAPKFELTPSESMTFSLAVQLSDGTLRNITSEAFFTSSNSVKAPITAKGGVLSMSSSFSATDPATITIIGHYKGFWDTFTVRVKRPTTPALNFTGLTVEIPQGGIKWGTVTRLKIIGNLANGGTYDLTSVAALSTNIPSELVALPESPGYLNSHNAFGGKTYQVTAGFNGLSRTVPVTVQARDLQLKIHSPLGNSVFKGQTITLFSRFESAATTDVVTYAADWAGQNSALNLNVTRSTQITIPTANLPLGSYTVSANGIFRGLGTNAAQSASFSFEVTESFNRVELLTKTPIISYRERAIFFLRLHLDNNSYLVLDPSQVTWSTNDPAKLQIDNQGIVLPTIASLENNSTGKNYMVRATFNGRTAEAPIRIVPNDVLTGATAELSFITLAGPSEVFWDSATPYVLTGHYSDGSVRDISAAASWSTSNAAHTRAGAFGSRAMLWVEETAYGGTQITVTALYQGEKAQTTVRIRKAAFDTFRFLISGVIEVPNGGTYRAGGSVEITQHIHYTHETGGADRNIAYGMPFEWATPGSNLNNYRIAGGRYNLLEVAPGIYKVVVTSVFRGRGFEEQIQGEIFIDVFAPGAPQTLTLMVWGANYNEITPVEIPYEFRLRLQDSRGVFLPMEPGSVDIFVRNVTEGRTTTITPSNPTSIPGEYVFNENDLNDIYEFEAIHKPSGKRSMLLTTRADGLTGYSTGADDARLPPYQNYSPKPDGGYCTQQRQNSATFGGGTGSAVDPFIICSESQLINMRQSIVTLNPTGAPVYVALGRSLNFSNTANMSPVLIPISERSSLDGRGYEISNVTILDSEVDDMGLFRRVATSGEFEVSNLVLKNPNIRGKTSVGALMGRASKLTATNIYVIGGTVWGESVVGGISGSLAYSKITSSYVKDTSINVEKLEGGGISGSSGISRIDSVWSNATVQSVGVQGGQSNLGGIVGVAGELYEWIYYKPYNVPASSDLVIADPNTDSRLSVIKNSHFEGQISSGTSIASASNVGGIAGASHGTAIIRCHNRSNIVASGSNVGGLVGHVTGGAGGWRHAYDGLVFGSTSSGNITGGANSAGASNVGGLVGLHAGGMILNSSAAGQVRGISAVGGAIGLSSSLVRIVNVSANTTVTSSSANHGGFIGTLLPKTQRHFLNGDYESQLMLQNNSWSRNLTPGVSDIGIKGSQRNLDVEGINAQ